MLIILALLTMDVRKYLQFYAQTFCISKPMRNINTRGNDLDVIKICETFLNLGISCNQVVMGQSGCN